MNARRLLPALPLLLCMLSAAAETPATVAIVDPWIREPPPGSGVAAGYLELRNEGARGAVLTGVVAPRFGSVEIHRTEVRNGVASMRRLNSIEIPAGGSVRLEPGGFHLMLSRKPPMPRDGDLIHMTFEFGDGSRVAVNVPVRGAAGATPPASP